MANSIVANGRGQEGSRTMQEQDRRRVEKVGGGHSSGWEGHVIDCGQPKHTDSYNTTMEDIANHICIEFKDGKLVAQTIAMGMRIVLERPEKEDDADETDIKIWWAEIEDFVLNKKLYKQVLECTYGIV